MVINQNVMPYSSGVCFTKHLKPKTSHMFHTVYMELTRNFRFKMFSETGSRCNGTSSCFSRHFVEDRGSSFVTS